MTLTEIKQAISDGKEVRWSNDLYPVIRTENGHYLITCERGSTIGLTWQDGKTMNCNNEAEFYIKD